MATTKRKSTVNPQARTRAVAHKSPHRKATTAATHPRAIALAVATAFLPWYLPQTAYGQAAPAANTLPNLTVTHGDAIVRDPQGNYLRIDQQSMHAIYSGSMSIGADGHMHAQTPGASAIGLYKDVSGNLTQIFGKLTSNGQIFISNQNGVLFGASARVDVGALFATSLSIKDQDFMAGRYHWYNEGNAGSVVNEGNIVTANGYTALVGPQVRNDGIIIARAGSVALAAGDRVSLDMIGDGLVSLSVDQSTYNASVVNTGSITADGGTVLLTARSANALLDTVINNSGTIRANSLVERNGQIILDGGNAGVVANSGTLQAAGVDAGTTGGTIKILGDNVGLFGTATLDASGDAGGGTVLVGGNYQGKGTEQNATAAYVGRDASLNADARTTGNGGRAIVWSDETTRVYGSISARGGAESGNGGLIETSGKAYLDVNGARVNASAAQGDAGTWLLDPRNVEVVAVITGNQVNDVAGVFDPTTTATAQVLASDITTALTTGGTNVTIHTGTDGADAGNITVSAAIAPVLTAARSLTFDAANDIAINQPITAMGNTLAVNLLANSANITSASGTGSVTVGAAITTNGGSFQSSGVAFNNTVGGAITTGAGTANIDHTGAVTIGANIGATDAAVSVTGSGVTVAAATTVNSGTAALSVNAGAGTLTTNAASLLLTTGTATLTADAMALDAASQVGGTAAATASAATAVIQPSTAGRSIGLAGGAGALSLTAAELATIRATNVRIGNATAGALQTGAWIPVATFAPGSLTLFANGITQIGAINLGTSTSDLLIRGAGDVVLDTDNVFAIVAASKSAGSLSIANVATNPLTAGSVTDDVGPVNGITAPGGVSLTASGVGGSLAVAQSISTTNNNISLTGTGVTVASGVSVSSGSGTILVDGNDGAIQLNDSTLTTTNATSTAVQIIDGTTAAVGNITAAFGTVVLGGAAGDNLSDAVTQNVSTVINADTVTVSSGGAVTLDGASNTLTNLGTVTRGGALTVVDSDGGLTLTGSATTGTTTNAVSITTAGGTLALGANAIVGDAVELTSSGATGDITSTAAGTITANATTVQMTAGRSVILGAAVSAATTTTIDFGQATGGTFSTNSAIATGTGVTINGGANGDTFDFSGAPAITATLNGAGASDTLIGRNAANTWTITGPNQGNVASTGTLTFSDVESLTGNADTDSFVFQAGGSVTGTVDGAGNTDSLNLSAKAGAVTINLQTGAFTGGGTFTGVESFTGNDSAATATTTLTGLDAGQTFTVTGANDGTVGALSFTDVGNLTGGSGVDSFVLQSAGTLTGNVNGGGNTDSVDLSAKAGAVSINLQTATFTGIGGTFSSIESFTGNDSAATATTTLTGLDAGQIFTLTGANDGTAGTFSFTDVGNLTGGSGTDSFVLSGGALTGSVNGGGGTNTLTADNVANTWTITGAGTGTLTGIGGTFSNIQNLTGNANTDSFVFQAGGSVTGTVDGAGNSDSLNLSAKAGAVTINLQTGAFTGGGTFTGVESFTGNDSAATATTTLTGLDAGQTFTVTGANGGTVGALSFTDVGNLSGGAGTDSFVLSGGTLTGSVNGGGGTNTLTADNVANTWTVTGAGIGTLTGIGGTFSNIQNLTGNADTDSFVFQAGGSVTGTVDGAGNSDSLNLSAKAGAVTINLQTGVFTGGGTFTNVESFTGNDSAATATTTLTGLDAGQIFTLTGANDGTAGTFSFTDVGNLTSGSGTDSFVLSGGTLTGSVNGGGGTNTLTADNVANTWTITGAGTGTLTGIGGTFSNIQNLTGNANTDSFVFQAGGSVTGTVDGAGNTDSLNLSAKAGAVTINLQTGAFTGGGTFTGVESFTGNDSAATATTTLTGLDAGQTFTVAGANGGTAGTLSFTDVGNLSGGAGTDSFVLSGGTLTGSVNGGGGTNTLTADNVANTWTITGAGTGTLTGIGGTFSNIQNLTGNANTDSFVFQAGGSVTGTVDGAGNTDSLNLSAKAGAVTINLQTGAFTGGGTFTGVESFTGNDSAATATTTLTGLDAGQTFTVTGANGGTVGALSFTDVGNLTGGSGVDSFVFQNAGTLAGNVTGGGNTDSVNLSAKAGAVSINLQTATFTGISGTFSSIESFTGNDSAATATTTLTGLDAGQTFTVTGANDGTAGTTAFTDVGNLTGGSGTDSLVLSGGTLTGSVNGGGGSNTLTADNGANAWTITALDGGTLTGITGGWSNVQNLVGGTSIDSFTLTTGTLTGSINGSAGNDTLTAADVANTWTITGPNSGTLTGTGGWSNIENLIGGTGTDSFSGVPAGSVGGVISDGGGSATTLSGTINSGGSQTYSAAVSSAGVTLNAGTAAIFATNAGNNFTGTLDVTGSSASITDMNALTIDATLTGALTTNSGALTYVAGTTVGSLNSTASGTVNQTGAITVTGASSINAGANSITLTSANDFQGVVSLTGGTTQITDANSLTLGNVNTGALATVNTGALNLGAGTVSGALSATTNGGNITQTGALNVTGTTNLQAGAGSILLAMANDFGGAVTAGGIGITLNDVNTLTPGTINAGSGSVNLSANALGAGGPVSAGSASSFRSNTNVNGLNINMANVPLSLTGSATQWNFISTPTAIAQPNPITVPSGSVGVTYNLASIVASVAQQQAASASSSVSASVAAVIVDEANKTFGTDSVAEDVEYGFAGEIGATPPMDHRIDESGISLPRCLEESREGVPCK